MNNTEMCSIGNELIDTVRDVFPKEAEIETFMDGSQLSFVCSVYWKLGNDANRPNKPSKIILIIISYETINDVNYKQRKQEVQNKFKHFIETQYNNFNPDHQSPREKAPPNETWAITTNILL